MDLLDKIYEKQQKKFPDVNVEDAWRKLRSEAIELQNATRDYCKQLSNKSREKVNFEKADVVIMANKIYHDNQDELAWLILDALYDFELSNYVEKKWEIVEKRSYHKDKNGNYQHDSEN